MGTTGNGGLQSRVNGALQIQGWNLRMTRTQNSGYRDQEWNHRWQMEADRAWGNDNVKHYDWLAFQDGSLGSARGHSLTATPPPPPTLPVRIRRPCASPARPLGTPHPHSQLEQEATPKQLGRLVAIEVEWTDKPIRSARLPFTTDTRSRALEKLAHSTAVWQMVLSRTSTSRPNGPSWRWSTKEILHSGSDAVLGSEATSSTTWTFANRAPIGLLHLSWAWDSGWRLGNVGRFFTTLPPCAGHSHRHGLPLPLQHHPTPAAHRRVQSRRVRPGPPLCKRPLDSATPRILNPCPPTSPAHCLRCWTLNARGPWSPDARHTLGEVVLYHQSVNRAIVQAVDSLDNPTFVNDTSSCDHAGHRMAGTANVATSSPQGSGTFQFHRWDGRRLARFAQVDGQRPAPLEGLGTQPHVDASNVDSRGGCHAAQHQRRKHPSRLRDSQCGFGMDASFRACGRVNRRSKCHEHGLFWLASNSTGLVEGSTIPAPPRTLYVSRSGTCADISTSEGSIEDHHLHPAVQGTAFLRLVVCHGI